MSTCCQNGGSQRAFPACTIPQGGCEVKSSWGALNYTPTPFGVISNKGLSCGGPLPAEPSGFRKSAKSCFETMGCKSRAY